MAFDYELVRWASGTEEEPAVADPTIKVPNKDEPPPELKSSGLKSGQTIGRQWLNHQFDNTYLALVDLQKQITNIVQDGTRPTLEAIYPVGKPYMSFDDTDPNTVLGFGTWSKIEGQFLLGTTGAESSGISGGNSTHTHNDTLAVGSHTLTKENLPAESPVGLTVTTTGSGATESGNSNPLAGDNVSSVSNAGNNITWAGQSEPVEHTVTGGIQSASNLPPFITIHMWRRTA